MELLHFILNGQLLDKTMEGTKRETPVKGMGSQETN
jgi:hypothetical protein